MKKIFVLLALLFVLVGCKSQVPAPQSTPSADTQEKAPVAAAPIAAASSEPCETGWITYHNTNYDFKVGVPSNEIIEDSLAGVTSNEDKNQMINLGRLGILRITKSEELNPDLMISAYTNKEALEKDHFNGTSISEWMKDYGLQSTTISVNGENTTVYYGVHKIDSEGGDDYPYIGVEVNNSSYAYMLEFFNTKDPNDPIVAKYLTTFKSDI